MKFAKLLALNTNPEWKGKYVSYKRLKRVIKRILFERDESGGVVNIEDGESLPLVDSMSKSVQYTDGDASSYVVSGLPRLGSAAHPMPSFLLSSLEVDHGGFFGALGSDLTVVNDFFRLKCKAIDKTLTEFEKLSQVHSPHVASTTTELGFRRIREVYEDLVNIREYAELNYQGARKIVKKYDKSLGTSYMKEFMVVLDGYEFARSDHPASLQARMHALISRDKLLELQDDIRRRKADRESSSSLSPVARPWFIALACVLFAAVTRAPILEDHPAARDCLAIVVWAVCMWVTEAVPYFATALAVPVLVTTQQVLLDPHNPGVRLGAKAASKLVLSHIFGHVSVLILGGFAVSAAFSRCQVELRVAALFQRTLGNRPSLFILSIMFLALVLSMGIGNHTAPILCTSLLLPVIRDFPSDSRFVKCLLLGLAFAANLGGMMTPIASLQNALAVTNLQRLGYEVSFSSWLAIAVPFCTCGVVVCWVMLLLVLRPRDVDRIPVIVYEKGPVTGLQVVVVVLCLTCVAMWATLELTVDVLGDLGIISLAFMSIVFGSGILTQIDFNSFPWHLLFLLGGGNALGLAVQKSNLLKLTTDVLLPYLSTHSPWLVTAQVSLLVLLLTSFISHTVAAIILMPLAAQIGAQVGHPHLLTISTAFACSAAMALPFSSFPNLNSLMVQDDFGTPYLTVRDFFSVGAPFSLITVALLMTLGYALILMMLSADVDVGTGNLDAEDMMGY